MATPTSARAIEAGLWNDYFGTLVGVHHESPTRGRAVEDAEFVAFHERHDPLLARWRLQKLAFYETLAPKSSARRPRYLPGRPDIAAAESASFVAAELPLRYRVADQLNAAFKHLARPLHAPLRRGLTSRLETRPGEPRGGRGSNSRTRSPRVPGYGSLTPRTIARMPSIRIEPSVAQCRREPAHAGAGQQRRADVLLGIVRSSPGRTTRRNPGRRPPRPSGFPTARPRRTGRRSGPR